MDNEEVQSVHSAKVHDVQTVHAQQVVPSLLKPSRPNAIAVYHCPRTNVTSTKAHSSSQSNTCRTAFSCGCICSVLGIDPTKFLTEDINGKHRAIWLEYQNLRVSDWVCKN